ncbi:hypothetical protein [Maridesulfovibrio salexigens]|uniref:Uncharacterized protein n=1 Tax=Maridesulfovibrio salexigens (strain ATCC 14822 / DSM 2638 / NCIMB 8403 / VKM B-1763) TaxID=526222 RepID=C6BWQ9_MARSD|nr:hypothetical protein [Maridesulfovibrio salexigens]ACS80339.1 hypothetical protein Desal_2283 [Maridesulfovibrio salexigens DSM 2638]
MVKQHRNNLFNDCELSVILENVCNSIVPQIEAIPEKEFFAASYVELMENIIAHNSIRQINLHEDKICIRKPILCRITPAGRVYRPDNGQDPPNLKDGIITQVEIPYSGDKRLLVSKPSIHYKNGGPSFTIKNDRIIKHYVRPLYSDPKAFKHHFMRNLEKIKKYLEWQANDISLFEIKLRKIVNTGIAHRRMRGSTIALHLDSKHGATEFNPIHVRSKLPLDELDYSGIPVISDEDFIKTIRVLRHTGKSFERTPAIYNVHNDQDLRNILVSNLNTHFSGQNNEDIFSRIGENGFTVAFAKKSALIGRCSTWRCAEGLIHTLNALLQKDLCPGCKIAMTIFNRTEENFNSLLKSIRKLLIEHPCLIKIEKEYAENEWHTIMGKKSDLQNNHWIHLMIFNLYFSKTVHLPHLTDAERKFFASM